MTFQMKPQWLRVIVIATCFTSLSWSQVQPSPASDPSQQSEENDLRAVIEKFFAAYRKKDIAEILVLWSQESQGSDSDKKAIQQQFTTEDLTIGIPTISRLRVNGDRALLRVTFEMTVVNPQTKHQREERLVRDIDLIKEKGKWRIQRYRPAAEDLAESLVKSKSEVEWNAILAENKDAVTTELVNALITWGTRLINQQDLPRAAFVHSHTQSLSEGIGDSRSTIRIMRNTGIIYSLQGHHATALEYFQQSLRLSETIADKDGMTRALNNSGIAYGNMGDYLQALDCFQQSLAISEPLGDKVNIALALGNIGNVYQEQGYYQQALEYHQKSLTISTGLHDKAGIARTLGNIGNIYFSQGNFAQALEYYQKSLPIKREIGDKSGVADILANVGSLYYEQNNYAQAIEYYQKAREGLIDEVRIAHLLSNIGVVYGTQGDYTKALENHLNSLKISETLNNKNGIAQASDNIGLVYASQGHHAQAIEYYHKSLATRRLLNDRRGVARTIYNIGRVQEAQGDHQQALKSVDSAAALARETGSLSTLWQARFTAGIYYLALRQTDQARQAFIEAIDIIENLRAQVAGGEQEQQRFFESKVSPYHAMIDLLVAQNDLAGALSYAERAKARVLLDVLRSGRINIIKAMTDSEREQEHKLNSQVASLNTQVYRENLRLQADPAHLNELKARLQKARLDLEAFENNIYGAHPELRAQRGEVEPLKLEETSVLLPDARTVLLEFVVTEKKTYLFVLTKHYEGKQALVRIKVHSLQISQKDLTDRTDDFRRLLANADNRFSKMARELYGLLLEPAAEQLRGKDRLVIVPDGPLWELPFQALQPSQDSYLIEKQSFFCTPSLTVLREMIKDRSKKSKPISTLLALGNPALADETVKRVKSVLMDQSLDPLPEAEQQVKTLGIMYSPNSKVYVGAEAREERFKSEAGDYQILHLATHAILNDRSPMYSQILLAQTDERSQEDGLLEAWELMKLDLKANLMVLSACETARGRVGRGEGMIGLMWSSFVAGVPTMVVSQWKVRSDSSAALMVEFHRRLKIRSSGPSVRNSVPEILREAALKIKGNSKYRHPFHWAGFIVVGDGY